MPRPLHNTAKEQERAYLVGVQRNSERERWRAQGSLDELGLLAETARAEVIGRTLLDAPHPATYVGKGKVDELKTLRDADGGYDIAVFDEELSPSQQRHLRRTSGSMRVCGGSPHCRRWRSRYASTPSMM